MKLAGTILAALLCVGVLTGVAQDEAAPMSFFLTAGPYVPQDGDVQDAFGGLWLGISGGIVARAAENLGFRGELGTFFEGGGNAEGADLTIVAVRGSLVYSPPSMSETPFHFGGGLSFFAGSVDYDGWGSESDSGIGLNLLGGMRWPNHLGLEAMLELVEISNVEFGGLHLRAVYTF